MPVRVLTGGLIKKYIHAYLYVRVYNTHTHRLNNTLSCDLQLIICISILKRFQDTPYALTVLIFVSLTANVNSHQF